MPRACSHWGPLLRKQIGELKDKRKKKPCRFVANMEQGSSSALRLALQNRDTYEGVTGGSASSVQPSVNLG